MAENENAILDEDVQAHGVAFQDHIISDLIPQENLPSLNVVQAEKTWLERLRNISENHRPLSRRAVDGIDTSTTVAIMAPDLIGTQGWSVEIKPKWGFLPRPQYLSDETRTAKTTHCRFCMKRLVKTHEMVSKNTSFCPLDLYSKDSTRLTLGLKGLWAAWINSKGSINNLKVFVGGVPVYPTDPSSFDRLASEFGHKLPEGVSITSADVFERWAVAVSSALRDSQVLQVLQNHQRYLDPLDIEGLVKLWDEVQPGVTFGSNLTNEVPLDEWEKFLDIYSKAPEGYRGSDGSATAMSKLRFYLLAYLLSAIFKDCSIIIRFVPNRKPQVTIIDLDPKPLGRTQEWAQKDKDIVLMFLQAGGLSSRCCVDDGHATNNQEWAIRV